MENNKIIRLNTGTKVLYSLFNFFAPISFMFMLACTLDIYSIVATLFSLLSIVIGLFCLISNLIKYNRFLCINGKTITICKGKINNPKVLQIIKVENIVSEDLNKDLTVKYENKKIKLLHTSFSVLGTICYIGPLVCIPILKNTNTALHNLVEISEILPSLFKTVPKKPSKTDDIIVNFVAWGFVLLVSVLGFFGILITPFYPFLNS
ncbi:MAG: hypothetical protein ACI37Q_04465 [Candidatus Gastranaerophilaceae bacterium]